MKILQVYRYYYPNIGGIEEHLRCLCTELNRLKSVEEIEVLVSNTSFTYQKDKIDDITVTRLPRAIESGTITPTMPFRLHKEHYDIIHFHLANPMAVISYLISKPNAKIIATYHMDIVKQQGLLKFYKPFLMTFLKKCDAIIATSPNYISSSPVLSCFSDKCVCIPYGVDLDRFRINSEIKQRSAEIRAKYGNCNIVLFVGRLTYYKGLEYLLTAIPKIEGILLIIGTGSMERQLKKICSQLNIEHKVFFLGAIENKLLAPYYYACDVFVLPSSHRSEAFGIVQVEAQLCKCPIVSTNLNTGTSFVNLDGKTGIVTPPRNPDALANAINILLNNQELRQQYGESGQKRAKSMFNKGIMTSQIVKLYKKVLSNS